MNQTHNECASCKPSVAKPWMKYFPESSLKAQLPTCSLYEYAMQRCKANAKSKALHYYGTSVTYKQLQKKIDQCADAFYALGVRAGDIVTFVTVTLPETIYALYGLNKIGAVSNYIDPRMDIARIRDGVTNVGSKYMVFIDLAWPKIRAIRKDLNLDTIIVSSANDSLPAAAKMVRSITQKTPKIPYSENLISWKELMAKAADHVEAAPYDKDDLAIITYTGGTTGTPKGVMLTNQSLNAMSDSFALMGVDSQPGVDRFLDIMPVFAAYGVGCGIHMPLGMGMENVLIPKFTPDGLGKIIMKYKPNHMMGVPSFYERFMHSKAVWDKDVTFLKTTGCGGDTMNPGLEARFNKFMKEHKGKYPLSQGYGMSELSGAATCCYGNTYKDDSAGIPLRFVTVGVFKPGTDEELDYNQEGEICITGPTVMKGYYNNPEETDAVLKRHSDGQMWVHSGDIGTIDEDGFIYIRGRVKQIIIKFDGHKVFPVQIESIIGRHKAVGTCAVVGIPDKSRAQGQVPLGIVELKSTLTGDVDKEAIRREIIDLCDELLEERGKPADITFIDEMLHTPMGKNDYRALSAMFKTFVPKPR